MDAPYRRLRRDAQTRLNEAEGLFRRASIQVEVARQLLDIFPSEEGQRSLLEADAAYGQLVCDTGLEQTVSEIEQMLAPFGPIAKSFTLHCVGHGHLDMNWMWSWPETVAATHDTFASVLSLMETYPELTYSQSQVSVYALIERHHPEMFERIKRRIAEGRWEVTAAQWVEGDKNLIHGESLLRSYQYAREYCADRFGLSPEDVAVQWEPDTFGHAITIPTLAQLGGVKYYYACRTGGGFDHERVGDARPALFWWESEDGSRLLVNRETSWYNSHVNIGDNIALPALEFFRRTGRRDWLNVYGIGNHGGGPTRREIEYYRELQTLPIFPRIKFSTARRFFEAVEDGPELPVIDHELNFEFTGCYTSQSLVKQANRLGEQQCLAAEALLAMAESDGLPITTGDHDKLGEAWQNVLFNQFHDILPGSGVMATREHARALFQETATITASLARRAMKHLADRVQTATQSVNGAQGEFEAGAGLGAGLSGLSFASSGGHSSCPVVVFNTLGWDREEVVEVHLWDTDFDPHSIIAQDAQGRLHPTFFIEQAHEWGHDRITVAVQVSVPAWGYAAFWLQEGTPDVDVAAVKVVGGDVVDAGFGPITFNRYRSGIVENLGLWCLTHETPRFMTSWVLGKELEPPRPVVAYRFDFHGETRNVATLEASGSPPMILGTHQLRLEGNGSHATTRTRIVGGSRLITAECSLDWREIGSSEVGIPGLAIGFALPGDRPRTYETPLGVIERNTEEEVPCGSFVHLPHRAGGITLLNDGKASTFVRDAMLYLRVIRSSFDPDPTPEVNQQTFRYGLVFHEQPPSQEDLVRLGMEFNAPLRVFATTHHEGVLAAEGQLIEWPHTGVPTSLRPTPEGRVLHVAGYGGTPSADGDSFDAMGRPCVAEGRVRGYRC